MRVLIYHYNDFHSVAKSRVHVGPEESDEFIIMISIMSLSSEGSDNYHYNDSPLCGSQMRDNYLMTNVSSVPPVATG